MNLDGIIIGVISFLIIGIYHPIVIKGEYYYGVKLWWIFLLMGILFIICSVITTNTILSAVLGVAAFSSFWGILELFHQRERVRKGWFPMNPKRKEEYNK